MIEKAKKIYLVGIKGVAMTALAIILKDLGKSIIGSDVEEIFPTDAILQKHSITILKGFHAENIHDVDLVITTAAHNGLQNSEVEDAIRKNIPVLTQAEATAELMNVYQEKIAVCGAHGKTTTSALLSFVLTKLGCDATYQVGAPSFSGMDGGHGGRGKYCVVEADEYVAAPGKQSKFLYLNPNTIIATNIDFDHPDVFKDLSALQAIYKQFFNTLKNSGTLTACADDKHLQEVVNELSDISILTYGTSSNADMHVSDIHEKDGYMHFSLSYKNKSLGEFSTQLAGEKNVLNCAAIILCCQNLQLDIQKVREYIRQFSGVQRRFEKIYEKNDIILLDDYGHHPEEIEATLKAAKLRYPQKRLVILFQSHTYSRTLSLKNEFIDALSLADKVLITDIFPSARENEKDFDISSPQLVREAHENGYVQFGYVPLKDILHTLSTIIVPNDVLITLGAGNLYNFHSGIIELIDNLEK